MSEPKTQDRVRPSPSQDAKGLLLGFLDYHRETVLWKTEGLSHDQATHTFVQSGATVAGIVRHLAFVERWWFRIVLAGENVPSGWTKEDPEAEWRLDEDETFDHVRARYENEIAISRHVSGQLALEAQARGNVQLLSGEPVGSYTHAWVVSHLIEETARHNGHLDILREMTDGRVGE